MLNQNAKKINYFIAYNFINGAKISRSDITVFNPATNNILCHIPESTATEVDSAVDAAKIAQEKWAKYPVSEKSHILYKASNIMEENCENFVYAEVKDSGKPFWEAQSDVQASIDCIRYFSGIANSFAVTGQYMNFGDNYAVVRREPLGVVGAIGVWNFPLLTACWKTGPCLAAGNSLIFKPSPLTPLTALMMADAFDQAGLPIGCLNIINGGSRTGNLLCQHPGIAKISFTGSANTGSQIAKTVSGGTLDDSTSNPFLNTESGTLVNKDRYMPPKRLTLELGGKSPLIIFEDTPSIELAVKTAFLANFYSQGATCSNGTRVFVQDTIYDAFVKVLLERLHANFTHNSNAIGDPISEKTIVGATISSEHCDKVLGYIRKGVEEGAKLLFGFTERFKPICDSKNYDFVTTLEGVFPRDDKFIAESDFSISHAPGSLNPSNGNYLMPVVFGECTDDMTVVREEIFGSVMCLLKFSTEEEVIRRANDTVYGLSGGVCTRDLAKAHRISSAVKTGTFTVNTFNMYPCQIPFGGIKGSGYGHECGLQSIEHYTQWKSIYVDCESTQDPSRLYCPYYDGL